jgi:hypothetical protein
MAYNAVELNATKQLTTKFLARQSRNQRRKNIIHRRDAGHEKKSIFAKISTCKYSILLRLILEFSSFFEFFLMTAEGAEGGV